MSQGRHKVIDFLFGSKRSDDLKLILLTGIFFFAIGAYTVCKELKDSIFATVVGEEYFPWAKIASMIVLVPGILFYSYLVDRVRRHQLLYIYSIFFGVAGMLFAYFLGDPVIGIHNTDSSPYRLFGWLFYFFVEGYSPFMVSVVWAFVNSVNSPESAKNNYSLLVAGSKLGGMLTAGFAWFLLSNSITNGVDLSAVANHQLLLVISSLLLLMVPIVTKLLIVFVPGRQLHGYESVYKIEKEREREHVSQTGLFSGLRMLIKQPYIFGVFSMIFFYELINVVLNYLRVVITKQASNDISGLTSALFEQMFWVHLLTFVISFLGTGTLLRKLGERRCLMLVPVGIGFCLFLFMINHTLSMVGLAYTCFRVLYYSLGYPVRECLWIPTVKEVKFKSKSWIDAFGSKFAKATGSGFTLISRQVLVVAGESAFFGVQSVFFAGVIGCWLVASYFLGRRFDRAVKNNEAIGAELL